MFILTLSVSKTPIRTKTEGNTVVDFTKKDFEVLPDSDLRELFTTRVYSTNYWKDGRCGKRNYLGMYGITLDVDSGQSLEAAKELFKDFNYIIHTSTSHLKDDASKGGVQDRFRIILPFAPSEYNMFSNVTHAYALYQIIIKKYPFVDTQCAEPARKYYPFLNTAFPGLYISHINDTGRYYYVDPVEVDAIAVKTPSVSKRSRSYQGSTLQDPNKKYIHLEDEVTLTDKVTKIKIGDIEEHTTCYCLFCDDLNSVSASGHITFTRDGKHMLICDHCLHVSNNMEGKYFLPLDEQYSDLLYVEDRLYRIIRAPRTVTMGKIPDAFLYGLPNDDIKALKHWLACHRYYHMEQFTMKKMVDPNTDKLQWFFNEDRHLEIHVPAVKPLINDNEYIDRWLFDLFGLHAEFIKDWLALYCFTNYRQLPILVFTGERGTGKTTFSEFVAGLFFGMSQDWSGVEKDFNGYFEKRLLTIDEAKIDKKDQYTLLKNLTGTSNLTVNKKYKPEYQIQNNLCLILTTNETVPMYLVPSERPVKSELNQFFMYQFPTRCGEINANIKQELLERAGWYIQTELRQRYEKWQTSNLGKTCRYSLQTPITSFLDEQFKGSLSSLDYECELMYKYLKKGYEIHDRFDQLVRVLGPYKVVSTEELKELIEYGKFDHKNLKGFKERLQAHGYLDKSPIQKDGIAAWEVLTKESR